ncbi:single-stranded DNA-binding protein [Angustibacter aerolatus]
MNEITTTVFGNVATEPRHAITPAGVARTSFRVASTAVRFDRELQGWVDTSTTWLTVVCWRGLALNVAQSVTKGQPVVVHGTLTRRDWDHDGQSGVDLEVEAVSVGHDLRRGSSQFAKVSRGSGGGQSAAGQSAGERAGEGAADGSDPAPGELADGAAAGAEAAA